MSWKKGESGNPKGRPKNPQAITSQLRLLLKERDPETRATKLRLVIEALYEAAVAGNVPAMIHIFERLDGKVVQTITTPPGEPFEVKDGDYISEITGRIAGVAARLGADGHSSDADARTGA